MNSFPNVGKSLATNQWLIVAMNVLLLVLCTPSEGQIPIGSTTTAPSASPAVIPPPAQVAQTSPPPPSQYVPAGYTEVFGDEFNEHGLDTSRWWTRYIYNNGMLGHLNDEKELFVENNNHVLTGSELQLTARKVKNDDPKGINYESGMIRSKTTFKYGYFETRLKVPAGKGVWPAFWLNSDASPTGKISWPPEIDIFEFVNNVKDDRPDMIHMGAIAHKPKDGSPNPWGGELLFAADKIFKPSKSGISGYYYAPFKFPDDYHVYALLWDTDDTVTWYIDGVELLKGHYKWVYTDGSDAGYAHVLLCLALGGKWAGRYGIDDSAFPQSLDIDYVRVYQKAGNQLTGVSTIGHDLYKVPAQ